MCKFGGTQRKLCDQDCQECFDKSFASQTRAKNWGIKNERTARQTFKCSGRKIWFDCDKCPHSFEVTLSSIFNGGWCAFCAGKAFCGNSNCKHCFDKSFASCEYSKFWSKKNELKPHQVAKASGKKFWFDCHKCPHSFEGVIYHVANGVWCNYCDNKKLCDDPNCKTCFDKSFASHPKSKFWHPNNVGTPRDYFKSSDKSFIFSCPCFHTINMQLSHVSRGDWCGHCSNPPKLLCNDEKCNSCFDKSFATSEKAIFWSDKNTITPRQAFKISGKSFWFKCENGHDFCPRLADVTSKNSWCPHCPFKTEQKLYEYMTELFGSDKIIRQFQCIGLKGRFDFYISDLKLIIEIDGNQHFKQISTWTSPEETLKIDITKMKFALANGYSVFRFYQPDVLKDKIDWQSIIKSFVPTTTPTCTYFSTNPNIYDNHQAAMLLD